MNINRYIAISERVNETGEFYSEVFRNSTYRKVNDLIKDIASDLQTEFGANPNDVKNEIINYGSFSIGNFRCHVTTVSVDARQGNQ